MAMRSRSRQKVCRPIDKPPQKFPAVIKPHPYDESGLKTCLKCGQKSDYRLHVSPHHYQPNYSSTLLRCMCGQNKSHAIHIQVMA